MTVIHRRLFWKIYLTLLASLVAVAVLMGSLWWLLGDRMRERWGDFHIHLPDRIVLGSNGLSESLAGTVQRLGDDVGADISVYDPKGGLVAIRGEPITLASVDDENSQAGPPRILRIDFPDGRIVLVRLRPPPERAMRILTVVFVVAGGVGLAAFPMTARLTRQLERLRSGVARWGPGALSARVDASGSDEVALVARTFNAAAERVERLIASQKALLANASHELRSPLARLRMAIELWLDQRSAATHAEIVRNLGEIDLLVDEILLASRLDHAGAEHERGESVDLLGLAVEEAARLDAAVAGVPVEVEGDPTLLRRLIRNLLENAARHGRPPVHVVVLRQDDMARLIVSDHGPGIQPQERERVFEPFYRPAGRGESGGGWGLGLSLVRQIATRHGGSVVCDQEPGGGSRFIVDLALRRQAAMADAKAQTM
jgi:signal transduction histidine kinase